MNVGVIEGVGEPVKVGEFEGVAEGVEVRVAVGESVKVPSAVGESVGDGEFVGVTVEVGVMVEVLVGITGVATDAGTNLSDLGSWGLFLAGAGSQKRKGKAAFNDAAAVRPRQAQRRIIFIF